MNHSHHHPGTWRVVKRLAPLIALALMLIMPALLPCTPGDSKAIAARRAAVLAAVLDTPYRFGHWISEDLEVPRAAWKLLRPNAVLSRRCREIDQGLSADLLVVYCDARDMAGHYPPVCYPANGWKELVDPRGRRQSVVPAGREQVKMCVYEFELTTELAARQRRRVFNCFLLPDGQTAIDMEAVRQMAALPAITAKGVAQVQVVVPGTMNLDDSEQVVSELLTGVSSLLAVLGQGAEDDHEPSQH